MRVDIEKIREAMAVIDNFNKLKLKELELFENGKKIEISSEMLEDFRFTGLNNKALIEFEWWKSETYSDFKSCIACKDKVPE